MRVPQNQEEVIMEIKVYKVYRIILFIIAQG